MEGSGRSEGRGWGRGVILSRSELLVLQREVPMFTVTELTPSQSKDEAGGWIVSPVPG